MKSFLFAKADGERNTGSRPALPLSIVSSSARPAFAAPSKFALSLYLLFFVALLCAGPLLAQPQGNAMLGGPVAQKPVTLKLSGAGQTSGAALATERFAQNTSSETAASAEKGNEAGHDAGVVAPPALPIDIGQVRQVRVAGRAVPETPLRVGNLDVLAPIVGDNSSILSGLGASATRAAVGNIPGNPNTPSNEQSFQINLPQGPPIVLTIGKATAYINNVEQPLRAAPLVMNDQIWLPVFSIAPLLGAAARLDPNSGTLHLNPTVQSVELFPAKGYTVLTVKTSAPLRAGAVLMGTMDNPHKVYFDFLGYSMGFDAANSPGERVVSAGQGNVERARAGLFASFPDKTRVVLDLKTKMTAVAQPLPDKTLFAVVIVPPGGMKPQFSQPPTPGPTPNGGGNLSGTMRGVTIVVDAGHGGSDSGARGARSLEKNHALDIARRLRNDLERRGATVLMTRDGDYFPSLSDRTNFANSRGADIFISVHIDSYRSTSTGTTTFFTGANSLPLAREVHAELVRATGRPNRGVRQRRLFVTRNTQMPSILTETAFISNPREEALLMNPNWRERVAKGMAQGLSNYVVRYGVNQ